MVWRIVDEYLVIDKSAWATSVQIYGIHNTMTDEEIGKLVKVRSSLMGLPINLMEMK